MTTTTSPLQTGVDVIKEYLKTLPESPGVYRMLSAEDKVLYVGKARRLKQRVVNYTRPDPLPTRLQRMISETRKMEFIITASETEALLLESSLIKKLQPRYNVLLKDDKAYPYILLTGDHDFPQIVHHRGKRNRKGDYFGPFASAGMTYKTIRILQRAFLLRNCTDSYFNNRKRPCMQYEIKRCSAPCVGMIDVEGYADLTKQAKSFLKGKKSHIQEELAEKMQTASAEQHYEKAAILRDRIRALTEIQSRQHVHLPGFDDVDIIALAEDAGKVCIQIFFYRNGQSYGNRSFFPTHISGMTAPEILSTTMAQFYAARPVPKEILLNMLPDDSDYLLELLSEKAERKVSFQLPKRGEKKMIVDHAERNADAALARKLAESSAQKKLLEGVRYAFGLADIPKKIEVYDNSHIQGAHAVGAYIVAGEDGFIKRLYRRYNVDAIKVKGDDYAMMRNVMRRRGERIIKDKNQPDLIILDGGKGQLSVAWEELDKLGLQSLNVFAIAKGEDRNAGRERFFVRRNKKSRHSKLDLESMPQAEKPLAVEECNSNRPATQQPAEWIPNQVWNDSETYIEEFSLDYDDPVLYYLQRLRDEAHRFAIMSHRDKRQRNMATNPLDDIPGIGATRKKALLHHFGSSRAVKAASIEDLSKVSGISWNIAEGIYNHFYGQ